MSSKAVSMFCTESLITPHMHARAGGYVIGTGIHLCIHMAIRECGSTLSIGLARTAPPTNTNFRLTFLLTRFQEALYEDLPV